MKSAPSQTALGTGALLLVTLIWAFSFGIIGKALAGLDPLFIGTVRLVVAGVCFAPFLRIGQRSWAQKFELAAIGALQFGVMYVSYLSAFRFLEAWQVALFSVLTPLWVTVLDAALRRQFKLRFFAAAFLSVVGAVFIEAQGVPQGEFLTGFLLMQLSNLAFAGGQVWFRQWKFRNPETREKDVFALLYVGGLAFTVLMALIFASYTPFPQPTLAQWAVLLYLGVVASGIGFFLWNFGASRVSAGFLAASNNLVVPFGVLIAIVLNKSEPNWATLALGSILIVCGLLIGRKRRSTQAA
ncbi:DMT family transporter [Puniceicoccus vermicola]|uniref:EamA family transporter n=1 Tax=Puniceicoccus vermicola TaxID=388746 RepID=A0A7X1E4S9_9BACT|nr:EamA family transporter [Puniceicoccus vermicola]MBC2602840.1 EamA family transporter [Puniceicoccus vermicola]